MNKEFVKKMIKAEMLRYEAIKEILPENLKNRVENLEKDAADFMKELALEILAENSGREKSDHYSENKKTAKKVEVDFS